jgi:hypothetical protein
MLLASAARLDAAGFAMSDNFTVFTPSWPSREDTQAYAAEVLKNAEAWRKEIARQWLGEELPPSLGKTTVNVSFSDKRDAGRTWAVDDARRRYHTLYLATTPDRAIGSTLAHEIVHVVLATRFPHPNRLPAWIEEGIASSYDDQGRQETRRQHISYYIRTGQWPDIESVLNCRTIAARRQDDYTVASSLTEFLLSRGDRQRLLEFGQSANRAGYDAALSKFYGINNTPDFQRAWQEWVKRSSHPAS